MLAWEIHVISLLTNTLVVVGYTILYNWLQTAKFPDTQRFVSRTLMLVLTTFAFVIFFHWSSLTSMAEYKGIVGYGWVFLNFQMLVVAYALLRTKRRAVFYSLAVLLTVWYWWLPNVVYWYVFDAVSLALMWLASRYGHRIFGNLFLYYGFVAVFAIPFFWTNYISLHGIDCGWPWQIGTYLLLAFIIRKVHLRYEHMKTRQANLMQEARIDELTQLLNFRVFNDDLQRAFTDYEDTNMSYALYTFDIDHFKRVNDAYGHLMGNRVLEQVARQLQRITSQMDYPAHCYRTGGEEFSFLVYDVTRNFGEAQKIAEQICRGISGLSFTADNGKHFGITISLGEDCALTEDQNYLDLYNRADKYLYASKRSGRNRMTIRGITLTDKNPRVALN
ncbi:diguanylate cyclase [Lacticaseibacillus pabuli]|uniref:Diguanylate cyclase n=1 Tax=Lacticaseibacillus pabuli TaxID=3025672 RepID=A0ABY7WRM5_9LACO|nr:diguanylate cyclase [Lacticaseibacillus sp. KACC 23028]WDF82827.1 diguanylate cyclase [Lacticaseibacillus sp. KACC 23028]